MLKAMVAGQPVEAQNVMYCCSEYDYYQEYYHPELCPAHMCAVHGDYGPVTVPMVSTNSSPPIAMPVQVPPGHVVQQIVDENGTLRHVIVSPQAMVALPPHYGPGPATGSNQHPQTFFAPTGLPPGFPTPPPPYGVMAHVPPPAQPGHSPPPHTFLNSERTLRQYTKLKKKLEQKQIRGDNLSNSSQGTPPVSPRKDLINGNRKSKSEISSVGTSEDGEESSSVQDEEDEYRIISDILSTVKQPQVTELNSRSALIQWSPPEKPTDSGEGKSSELDISDSEFRYEVLLSDKGKEGKFKMIYTGDSLSCRIQDLRPNTEYSVCVTVSLDEIQGPLSEATVFTTLASEPEQPQPPKLITRSRTHLQLRWSATESNGSPITQYILEYDDGKGEDFIEIYKSKGKQHNVMKLQPSTCYRFRLAAVNELGRSPYSEIVAYTTSGSVPAQPAPPVLKEASTNTLHLTWQRRPNDDEFTLQMDDIISGYGFRSVHNGKETQYIKDGLRRHTEYKFRLQAHNDEGHSRFSDEVCYRTLPDRPAAPSRPTVKGRIHARSFHMKWEPPSDRGGADITTYILELDGGSGFEAVYTGPDTEFVCDRLMPGTTYQLRVSCISIGGHSDSSDPCTVTTEAVCPGQCPPPRVYGKPRATSLTLKWSYPENDGGSHLTEFEVEMTNVDSTRCIVYKGKDTECTFTDLSPGQQYVFRVRSFNRVGASPWSDILDVSSGAAPPNPPAAPQIVCRSPHLASVQWEEPVSNGATVTDYRLEMSCSDREQGYETVFQGYGNMYEVRGLAPATVYFFRIQAGNSAGWSALSPLSTIITPPSSPAAVMTLRFNATPTSLQLNWQAPACHGSEILYYCIEAGDRTVTTEGPQLEYTLSNLLPCTPYRLRIQAVNDVGPGPYSPIIKATTLPLPPSPPKMECTGAGHNYLKLKWGDGKNPEFTQYTVEMSSPWSKDFHCVYQGTSHSCKVNRLQELSTCRFRIAASNSTGKGDYSEIYEFSTCIAPPPTLKAPRACETTQRSCSLEWNPCKPVCSDPVIYQVQLSRLRDQDYKQVYKGPDTKVQLNDLEPGADYSVRVCPIRQAMSGDLPGAYSPSATFSTSPAEPVTTTNTKAISAQTNEKKSLTDQQWAMIILSFFTLFAIMVAVMMQQVIHLTKTMH